MQIWINIEKIAFKVFQIKFLAKQNKLLIYLWYEICKISQWSVLNMLIMIFGIKEKSIILTHTMYCWRLLLMTQVKIFLMKSESSLTLHRHQRNWNVPRLGNIVKTVVKQWLNFHFAKLYEYFCAWRKKNDIIFTTIFSPSYCLSPFWRVSGRMRSLFPERNQWLRTKALQCCLRGQHSKASRHIWIQILLLFLSPEVPSSDRILKAASTCPNNTRCRDTQ